MSFEQHPMLWRVCLTMALDNGGINRDRPVRSFRKQAEKVVFQLAHAPEDLRVVEDWIATLDEDQIELLSGGEDTEACALLSGAPLGAFLDQMLDQVFEEAV